MKFTRAQLEKSKKRKSIDTEDDAWAGYKPKYVKNLIQRVNRYYDEQPRQGKVISPEEVPPNYTMDWTKVDPKVVTKPRKSKSQGRHIWI